jgi:hypothetical protein
MLSVKSRAELGHEDWLREVAKLSGKSYGQLRVIILKFLDTDICNISSADCMSFLSPLLHRWDMDLRHSLRRRGHPAASLPGTCHPDGQ